MPFDFQNASDFVGRVKLAQMLSRDIRYMASGLEHFFENGYEFLGLDETAIRLELFSKKDQGDWDSRMEDMLAMSDRLYCLMKLAEEIQIFKEEKEVPIHFENYIPNAVDNNE